MFSKKSFFITGIVLLALLLFLSACEKPECETNADCVKPNFEGVCSAGKCSYTPIPGVCGNGLKDTDQNECTCPADYGECSGSVGKYLVKSCDAEKQCVTDIPETNQEPESAFVKGSSSGDIFSIIFDYKRPLNLKKDTFDINIELDSPGKNNVMHRIKNIELTGIADRRSLVLGRKAIDRPLWSTGKEFAVDESLILDKRFVKESAAKEDVVSVKTLKLMIDYEFIYQTPTRDVQKTAAITIRVPGELKLINPQAEYKCPEKCPEKTGHKPDCGQDTDYFCVYETIPNVCGNFRCEEGENQCNCAIDCGVCSGDTTLMIFSCVENKCVADIKGTIVKQPQSIFHDIRAGPVQLQNNYKFNTPFNTKEDKMDIELSAYLMPEDVNDFKITAIRLLEGTQVIASQDVKKVLPREGAKTTVELKVPEQVKAETERALTLGIWYEYKRGEKQEKGHFTKSLGKITLLTPG